MNICILHHISVQLYADYYYYRRTMDHFSWINPNKSNSSVFVHLFNIQMESEWEWKQEQCPENWWIDVTYVKRCFRFSQQIPTICCRRAQYKIQIIIIEPSTLSFFPRNESKDKKKYIKICTTISREIDEKIN